MHFNETPIAGLYLIDFELHTDSRGSFSRLFCKNELKSIGFKEEIVQINYAFNSVRGTTRGLHLQTVPSAENKFVTCMKGRVFDIIVDLRKGSESFLKWYGIELTEEKRQMILVPKGCAHGYQTLEDNTQLLYFHSEYYNGNSEFGINFNDPLLKINLPLEINCISERDYNFKYLDQSFQGVLI